MRSTIGTCLLAASTGLLACEDTTTRDLIDDGAVCLETGPFDALLVTVEFPGCISSTCDTVLESTCSVERVDGTLELHAHARIESRSGECTLDCGVVSAACTFPDLPAGEYTLRYGSKQATLTAPAEPQYHFHIYSRAPACANRFRPGTVLPDAG